MIRIVANSRRRKDEAVNPSEFTRNPDSLSRRRGCMCEFPSPDGGEAPRLFRRKKSILQNIMGITVLIYVVSCETARNGPMRDIHVAILRGCRMFIQVVLKVWLSVNATAQFQISSRFKSTHDGSKQIIPQSRTAWKVYAPYFLSFRITLTYELSIR